MNQPRRPSPGAGVEGEQTLPRILVVEDDDHVAQGLCWALRLRGFATEVCGSGEEALALTRVSGFDLVICDLRLPGMSGRQLVEQLAAAFPGMRRILITGYGSAETQGWAATWVDAYLVKPFGVQDLVETVQRLVNQTPCDFAAD